MDRNRLPRSVSDLNLRGWRGARAVGAAKEPLIDPEAGRARATPDNEVRKCQMYLPAVARMQPEALGIARADIRVVPVLSSPD